MNKMYEKIKIAQGSISVTSCYNVQGVTFSLNFSYRFILKASVCF